MYVIRGLIYKAKQAHIYNIDTKKDRQFNCYSPCMTGNCGIVDCWVCTKNGEIHPGYNKSGVPIDTDVLGAVVGQMDI